MPLEKRDSSGPASAVVDGGVVREDGPQSAKLFEIATGIVASDHEVARFAIVPGQETTARILAAQIGDPGGLDPSRELVVISDGAKAHPTLVAEAAGREASHILNWFHLPMKFRYIEQTSLTLARSATCCTVTLWWRPSGGRE